MEPTGNDESNANMAIIATYTTASLLDDSENQQENAASREKRKGGMRSWLIAGTSGLLRRGSRKGE
jgi:hypothetical protein